MTLSPQIADLEIILADDDVDDCYFFKEALKESNVSTKLTVVEDGEQLVYLLKNNHDTVPDVIFLDLNMPRKNGFECLSEIKTDKRLNQIPVVVYSTSFHKEIATMLYINGANYYISKPSDISILKNVVQKMIHLIANGNSEQPQMENFLLTIEQKNAKALVWFKEFFTFP